MPRRRNTVPLLAELRRMGIGGCGTARPNLKGFPKELDIGKKAKIPYHSKMGVVKDRVGIVVWMDSAPVTVMTTIHVISGDQSEQLRHRWHPGDKSTNATAANREFQGARQKEMMVPTIILDYNRYKVGVDVADQYRTYYDKQLTSRRNWYPIFYWVLETALINSLFIYRDQTDSSIEHLEYRLDIAWALIERGSGIRMIPSLRNPVLAFLGAKEPLLQNSLNQHIRELQKKWDCLYLS